jgi:hypothetical protein
MVISANESGTACALQMRISILKGERRVMNLMAADDRRLRVAPPGKLSDTWIDKLSIVVIVIASLYFIPPVFTAVFLP